MVFVMSNFSGRIKMTDKQIFQCLGVIYLAVGLGMLSNPQYYKQMMMDFKNNRASMYMGGIFLLAIGFLLVTFHNIWAAEVSVIITVIGWIALVKGILLLVLPEMMMKSMDIFLNKKNTALMVIASLVVILGVLLAWLGFFI